MVRALLVKNYQTKLLERVWYILLVLVHDLNIFLYNLRRTKNN